MGLPVFGIPGLSVFFDADDGAGGGGGGGNESDPPKDPPPNDPAKKEPIPYDRFQEVNNRMKTAEKELAEFRANQKKEEETRLANEKQFQQLADQKSKEVDEKNAELERLKSKNRGLLISTELEREARNAGVNVEQLPFVLRAVETTDVVVDDTSGAVTGAKEAIAAIKKAFPNVFDGKSTPSGPGGTPGKPSGKSPSDIAKAMWDQTHHKKEPIKLGGE